MTNLWISPHMTTACSKKLVKQTCVTKLKNVGCQILLSQPILDTYYDLERNNDTETSFLQNNFIVDFKLPKILKHYVWSLLAVSVF